MSHNHDAPRRLALLTHLSLATRYKLPLAGLKENLDIAGYPCSTAKLTADVVFLEETGLVRHDVAAKVVELTCDGLEVVRGELRIPGVGRPGPEA